MNAREKTSSDLGLWQVATTVPARALEAAEDALGPVLGVPGHGGDDWVAGVHAFTTIPSDPDAEPTPDLPWRIEALCADPPDVGQVEAALRPVADGFGFELEPVEVEEVASIDWVMAALASHPPVRAGRFYVHGTHEPTLPRGQAIDLKVDAGRAFGTGNHQSTQGCLLALDWLAKRQKFNRLLDVGTGSGILALAMAKRWRVPVLGIDIDPVAARIAADYAVRNEVSSFTRFVSGDGFAHREITQRAPYDLITANILARPLKRMAPAMRKALSPGGYVVMAGILDRHERLVLSAYETQGMALAKRYRLQEWTTLVLKG